MRQGKLTDALDTYNEGHSVREALVGRDPANAGWQRDLSISYEKIGYVQLAKGDLMNALNAYKKGLAIREALVVRDQANIQWQLDVAILCSNLGVHALVPMDEQRVYLLRGLEIQQRLKDRNQLPPNQDHIEWFQKRLKKFDS